MIILDANPFFPALSFMSGTSGATIAVILFVIAGGFYLYISKEEAKISITPKKKKS